MSMISAQIDELRRMADGQATYRDARAAMLQAADTIWELRDDLQRANAENAKLREELESVGTAAYLYGRSDLKAENAKLRELVSNCHGWLAVNCEKGYVIPRNGLDAIEQSMRELGMEVDV